MHGAPSACGVPAMHVLRGHHSIHASLSGTSSARRVPLYSHQARRRDIEDDPDYVPLFGGPPRPSRSRDATQRIGLKKTAKKKTVKKKASKKKTMATPTASGVFCFKPERNPVKCRDRIM